MKKYTVISISENGQINADFVKAKNAYHAFYVAGKLRKKNEGIDCEFVAALRGHIVDGDDGNTIDYPGQCSVYTADILDKDGPFYAAKDED